MSQDDSVEVPSGPKRLKSTESRTATYDQFFLEFDHSFNRLKTCLDNLKQKHTSLGTFEIGSCNAADPDYSYCFTKAECTIRPTNTTLAFASLFFEPYKVLTDLFCKKSLPRDGPMRLSVEKLIAFLMNKDIQKPLRDAPQYTDEGELTVLLAMHLFSQLSLSSAFTVDNTKPSMRRCCCSQNHGKVNYGDTSIGNLDVWHGPVDLIMEGAEVIVHTEEGYMKPNEEDDPTVHPVKQKDFDMTDASAGSSVSRLAAETITYSFYYHYLHPELSNSLIPCIGVSSSSVVFYFYDSVNDVLLGSTKFPLLNSDPDTMCEVNIVTLFALWMVLNHKYHCNGLTLIGGDALPKANFVNLAREKLDHYASGLKRRDLVAGLHNLSNRSVDPVSYINGATFVSPTELDLDVRN